MSSIIHQSSLIPYNFLGYFYGSIHLKHSSVDISLFIRSVRLKYRFPSLYENHIHELSCSWPNFCIFFLSFFSLYLLVVVWVSGRPQALGWQQDIVQSATSLLFLYLFIFLSFHLFLVYVINNNNNK